MQITSGIDTLLPKAEKLYYYWDVPEVIATFGISKPSSVTARLDLPFAELWLRMERTQAAVISWRGFVSQKLWEKAAWNLDGAKIQKVKMMSGQKIDWLPQTRERFWWANDWDISRVKGNYGYLTRKALGQLEFYEVPHTDEGVASLMPVFERWVEGARSRHFMLTTGHYRRMIEHLPYYDRCRIYMATLNEQPIGFVGGYVYPEQNFAVITLVKHDFTYQRAGRGLWAYCIQKFHELGCERVNCGDTVDSFKQTLGLTPDYAYRMGTERIEKWLLPKS